MRIIRLCFNRAVKVIIYDATLLSCSVSRADSKRIRRKQSDTNHRGTKILKIGFLYAVEELDSTVG